jgi:hypothetical protein
MRVLEIVICAHIGGIGLHYELIVNRKVTFHSRYSNLSR